MTTTPTPGGIADLTPLARRKEQRAWYWYDWANSAYVTTIATVLFAPYLTSVAEKAACGFVGDDDRKCTENLSVLGVSVSPGSLVFYVVTVATIFSALVLPIVGAHADRSPHKRVLMGRYAWAGATFAALMFFVTGSNWQLGALLLFGANIMLGASLVVYDAILCEIAVVDERDRVSSRGWAMGYLGGGLLLAVNLAIVTLHDSIGLSTGTAVRVSMLSAALWWAGFTIIPYLGIKDRPAVGKVPESGGLVRQSFGQLAATLKDLKNYPVTLTFLLAYLFYNDGIQTVIASSSVYGEKELGFETSVLIATILLVQFVAFFGALLFGRLARAPREPVDHPGRAGGLGGDRERGLLPAGEQHRAVPRARGRDRPGPGRHPGALPLVLQHADPAGQGSGVLLPLPGLRAGHELAGHAGLRRGPPADRLLPAGDLRADPLLRGRRPAPVAGRPPPGHRGGGQRAACGGLSRSGAPPRCEPALAGNPDWTWFVEPVMRAAERHG